MPLTDRPTNPLQDCLRHAPGTIMTTAALGLWGLI